MIKVLVEFCIDADIIECPEFIIKDLKTYQSTFKEWIYDKKNNHSYWMYSDGEKSGCKYRSPAFVEWLNTFVLNESYQKAKVIEEYVNEDGHICRAKYPTAVEGVIRNKIEAFKQWLQAIDKNGCYKEAEYLKKYGNKRYIEYAAVDWINEFILIDGQSKAYVMENQLELCELECMPKIYF